MAINMIGSSYTGYTLAYEIHASNKPPVHEAGNIEVTSASSGEILNLYSKLVLDSDWQLIDEEIGSTFVLGRKHMFYSSGDSFYKTLVNEAKKENEGLSEDLKEKFDKKTSLTLLHDSFQLLIEHGIGEQNTAMASYYKKVQRYSDQKDESIYNTLIGNSTKKISENHFAVSNHNLIYHEIAINDNVYNTVKMDYEVFAFDNSILMTVLPKIYSPESKYNQNHTIEKIVEPLIPAIGKELNGGAFDRRKTTEFLSNELLEELRWCYQGKIFVTHIPSVKRGDTITLLDSVSSTFGKFTIDTFEHILDSRGLLTVLNVKACFDFVDPYIDIYNLKISLELSDDLKKVLGKRENSYEEQVALANLVSLYNKAQITNTKYCKMIECQEPDFFNGMDEYAPTDTTFYTPPLALRFIPFSKKGKVQIPESLKSAFLHEELNPFSSFMTDLTNRISESFVSNIRGFTKWSKAVGLFIGDAVLDIATYGLHELVKSVSGYTASKALKATTDESFITKDAIEVLLKKDSYADYKEKDSYDFTFGFFNVEAQRKTNVVSVTNEDTVITYNSVKESVRIKSSTINKIINNYFDACGCVEMYTSFKFDNSNYEVRNFVEDVKPENYTYTMEGIFTNKYGEEKGVLYYDMSKVSASNSDELRSVENVKRTFKSTAGDTTRSYMETTIDVSDLGYINKNGGKITKIKFIWFHNIFGSTDLKVDSRIENVKDIIKTYGTEYSDSNPENETGIVIMGDHNVEVVNPGTKPKGKDIVHLFLDKIDHKGFRNYMTKPTTLTKKGLVEGSIYENVLLSPNLINNKEWIDVMRVMYFEPGVERNQVSDHVPAFVGFKKRN
ncbi:MAG: hypothetical protein ACRCX2_05280 [Paraclostridium sp.]